MLHQVSENPVKNRDPYCMPLVVIAALLVTMYITANIMAVKLISVGGLTFFDAGTITFPFAYMLGDVLTEVWGYKTARKVIVLTFFCNIILVVSTAIGLYLPSPEYTAETTAAYAQIFSYVPRIVAASLAGFLLGELSNAWVMERIKIATKGRHLWLRAIGSSMVGYIFDTVLFVLIAFAGTAPWQDLLTMMAFQYIAKVLLEGIGATPLTYLVVGWLKKHLPQGQL
ncbi:MAG: queuosine precursor transporter [Desulfovibrionaceae bacterium]|nr:queuosine precursor transporter [Desulfovibrionaceae bacterium]